MAREKNTYVRPTYDELVAQFGETVAKALTKTWKKEDGRKADPRNASTIDLSRERLPGDQVVGARNGQSMTHFELPPDVPKPTRRDE